MVPKKLLELILFPERDQFEPERLKDQESVAIGSCQDANHVASDTSTLPSDGEPPVIFICHAI